MTTKKTAAAPLPETTEAQADLSNAAPAAAEAMREAAHESLETTDDTRYTTFQVGDIVTSDGKDRHKVLQLRNREGKFNLQLDVTADGKAQAGDTAEKDQKGYVLVSRP